jgi:hypothetical protein
VQFAVSLQKNCEGNHRRPLKMSKTKQQLEALDYAMDYLEVLLKMEDVVGCNLNQRIDQAVQKYIDAKKII